MKLDFYARYVQMYILNLSAVTKMIPKNYAIVTPLRCVALKKAFCVQQGIYFELVYLVTAFVPSLTACFASSPGRRSLTDV